MAERIATDPAASYVHRPGRHVHLGAAVILGAVAAVAVAHVPASASQRSAVAGSLTLRVDSVVDAVDARPGDGQCRTSTGTCTLRAAVQEANLAPSRDVIFLPEGRIDLTIAPRWPFPSQTLDLELDPANGDLDVIGALTVRGVGANRTTVDARGLDRIFNVTPGATLALQGVRLTGGDATRNNKTPMDISDGGAVLNAGTLTLDGVSVVGNRADGGGGVFSIPFTRITVRNSLIARNAAVEGGGLRIDGAASITNTTISGNYLFARHFPVPVPDEMTGYGGGIDHRGTGDVVIVNSTITGNRALKAGGGYNSGQNYAPVPTLSALWPYRTYLLNTIVYGNTAGDRPSDCHVSAMVIHSRGHNLDGDGTCARGGTGDQPRTNPRLGGLGSHGGPTPTRVPRAGSPAIDAGGDAGCPANDQRGLWRPRGRQCDVGAVER
jgi:CSLREA domain-containing protein